MLKDPQNYPYEMIQNLISTLQESDREIAALAYGTGARASELNQLRVKDITQTADHLRINCPVLKKRTKAQVSRIAVIRLDETWLVEPILALMKGKDKDEILLPYHRITIYRKLISSMGINPHGFRKLRATHLATKFKFTGQQLTHFFGWGRSDQADAYIKLNTEDIEY